MQNQEELEESNHNEGLRGVVIRSQSRINLAIPYICYIILITQNLSAMLLVEVFPVYFYAPSRGSPKGDRKNTKLH